MAHEIDTTTGRAAVFATGTPPWHGLGTVIESAATSKEAIDLAALNWHVAQWPVYAPEPGGCHAARAPRFVANVRTDTRNVLGVVGTGYRVFQNAEAFDFMDSLVGDKLAMFETAGALQEGRRVWMLARIPKEYRAGPDDVILPYVLLVNSHDGSNALRMIPTSVRVVCQNTLNLAMRNSASDSGGGISIRHKQNLDERVREARMKLGVIAARFDQFDEELHAMLERDLRPRNVAEYFADVMPLPKEATDRQRTNHRQTIAAFESNFENDTNSLAGVRGTVWAAYNAVSEWADHQRKFRGESSHQRAENRLSSTWFGASHHLKQKAYARALELAK
jgi:phage/plasmid-like protein (TIGR03299 family)